MRLKVIHLVRLCLGSLFGELFRRVWWGHRGGLTFLRFNLEEYVVRWEERSIE
jgi:hypothetical protein